LTLHNIEEHVLVPVCFSNLEDLDVKELWNLFQSTWDSHCKPGKYFLKKKWFLRQL